MNTPCYCIAAIFLLSVLLTARICNGQKPSFGIKARIVFSNATIKEANVSSGNPDEHTKGRTGITGGIYLNAALGNQLIFRPGLEIVSKGVKMIYNNQNIGYKVSFTYLDIPINFLYKTDFTKGHLLAGGGPYIGVPIQDYYGLYSLKTDVGINALAGYETAIGFSFNLNYSYGTSNASKHTDQYSKISNRYLGITLGYSF